MNAVKLIIGAICAVLCVSCSPPERPTRSIAPTSCPVHVPTLQAMRVLAGSTTDIFVIHIQVSKSSYDDPLLDKVDTYKGTVTGSLMGSAGGQIAIGLPIDQMKSDPCDSAADSLEMGAFYLMATIYNGSRDVYLTGYGPEAISKISADDAGKVGTTEEPEIMKIMRKAIKSPVHPRR